jgi:hypothetical protein
MLTASLVHGTFHRTQWQLKYLKPSSSTEKYFEGIIPSLAGCFQMLTKTSIQADGCTFISRQGCFVKGRFDFFL